MNYETICATKTSTTTDGRVRIEFFDFRSGESLKPLADAISKSLNASVREIPYDRAEDLPRDDFGDPVIAQQFEWAGKVLTVTWEDEFGSHVLGTEEDEQVLKELAQIFSGTEHDERASPSSGHRLRSRSWAERILGNWRR